MFYEFIILQNCQPFYYRCRCSTNIYDLCRCIGPCSGFVLVDVANIVVVGIIAVAVVILAAAIVNVIAIVVVIVHFLV